MSVSLSVVDPSKKSLVTGLNGSPRIGAVAEGQCHHWSTRTMAAASDISEASVRRIWRAHGLKPHLVRTF